MRATCAIAYSAPLIVPRLLCGREPCKSSFVRFEATFVEGEILADAHPFVARLVPAQDPEPMALFGDEAGVDEFVGDWMPKYLDFFARFIADECAGQDGQAVQAQRVAERRRAGRAAHPPAATARHLDGGAVCAPLPAHATKCDGKWRRSWRASSGRRTMLQQVAARAQQSEAALCQDILSQQMRLVADENARLKMERVDGTEESESEVERLRNAMAAAARRWCATRGDCLR